MDPDGDTIIYYYEFLVDGVPSGYGFSGGDEFDTLTLPASVTAGGEVWTCEVRANDDGAAFAGKVGRASVTVESCISLDFDGGGTTSTSVRRITTWASSTRLPYRLGYV